MANHRHPNLENILLDIEAGTQSKLVMFRHQISLFMLHHYRKKYFTRVLVRKPIRDPDQLRFRF